MARTGFARALAHVFLAAALAACGGTTSTSNTGAQTTGSAGGQAATQTERDASTDAGATAAAEPAGTTTLPEGQRQPPPQPGPRRDVHFPAITRANLTNGLEVDVVEYHTLPVVHLRLVVKSAGSARDPRELPGLASFTGDMLKEGTRAHTSQQIAETIEFVGGTLDVLTTPDATTIACSVLNDHVETALDLLAEIVTDPIFPQAEIDKLKRRELDRLTRSLQEPSWLSAREFYAAVYGPGTPYGHFDATRESIQHLTRDDLVRFHRNNFVAGAMYLAAVGDVRPAEFRQLADRALRRVRRGTAAPVAVTATPLPARQIVLVDRPDSAQSLIRIGNVAINRSNPDYVPLAVANQVLGGEASSRLFMDLRERRSLTYGAYSRIAAQVASGTFQASGAVRTPVTAEALAAFYEHLTRIAGEAPADTEVSEAEAYLTDSFSLALETPADLARLLVDLRLYGLPDDYWDTFRAQIARVDAAGALAAAHHYIQPDHSVAVVVGAASQFEHELQRIGPVRVVDLSGRTVRELPYTPAPPAAQPTPPPAQPGDAGR